MRILGIDPALRTSGFGVIEWEGSKFRMVSAGTIGTNELQPHPARLLKIHESVRVLLGRFKPDVIVLEKIYAHYRHPATAFVLGQARGIICLACASAGIPVAEYAATRVKKALTGNGLAPKPQVQRAVANLLRLGVPPRSLDITDALALALAFCYLSGAEGRLGGQRRLKK